MTRIYLIALGCLLCLLGALAFYFGSGAMLGVEGQQFVVASFNYRALYLAFGYQEAPYSQDGDIYLKIALLIYILGFLAYVFALSFHIMEKGLGRHLYHIGAALSALAGILLLFGFLRIPTQDGYSIYPSDGFLVPGILGLFAGALPIMESLGRKYLEQAQA